MLVLLTPTLANAATVQVDKPNASLTAKWWKKFVAIPDANSLERCDVGTRKKHLFLAGTTGGSATRSCTTDKDIFLVPLINVECSTAEFPLLTTFPQLRKCAKDFADDFTDLELVVDGREVSSLSSLRVQAKGTFTSVENNVFNIPPTEKSKFASDGYWALIKLTPGEHTLTFGGSYVPVPGEPALFTTEVTYHLLVKN
jgi:hypothetical protein